ncbi:hypothetical protein V5H41_29305, partial [Salmonella enterica]
LYLEDDIRPGVSLQKESGRRLARFAAWQRASRVTLGQCPLYLEDDIRPGVSLQKESGRRLARFAAWQRASR